MTGQDTEDRAATRPWETPGTTSPSQQVFDAAMKGDDTKEPTRGDGATGRRVRDMVATGRVWLRGVAFAEIRVAITCVALAVFAIKVFIPFLGDRIDQVALGIFFLAFVPWAPLFIKSLKVGGSEIVSHDPTAQTARTNQKVLNAEVKPEIRDASEQDSSAELEQKLDRLADEYVQTRREMASGSERTNLMETLFRNMVEIGKGIDPVKFDVRAYLGDSDSGRNLAGIAVVYAKRDPTLIDATLDCAMLSNQPFVQYWGLLTVWRIVQDEGAAVLSLSAQRDIRDLRDTLSPTSERGVIVASLVDQMETTL